MIRLTVLFRGPDVRAGDGAGVTTERLRLREIVVTWTCLRKPVQRQVAHQGRDTARHTNRAITCYVVDHSRHDIESDAALLSSSSIIIADQGIERIDGVAGLDF